MSTTTSPTNERLSGHDRCEALLDATLEIVLADGVAAVNMGTVAERAQVARSLLYKHFANKEQLLSALYHREAAAIDRSIRRQVTAAPAGFVPKFRAYVKGVVGGVADANHPVFAPLQAASANDGFSTTQDSWDRRTVNYFADLAAQEYGIEEHEARSAMSMLLGGITPLLAQAHATTSRTKRTVLQDRYIRLVIAALHDLGTAHP